MAAQQRVLSANVMSESLSADELDPADVVAGAPQPASVDLDETTDASIGIWQITPGTVTDTEVDEVFLVLAGSGQISFGDGSTVPLAPGVLVRLHAGDRTTWTITETVRKVFIILPVPTDSGLPAEG